MDKIKSAYEMALERLKQRKEVSQAEIERMEYVPIGKAAAAHYLGKKDYDILSEINKHPENMRGYVLEGAQETFLNNILLPTDKNTQETNKRAMEGLLLIKRDKRAVGEIFSQLEHLFQYYERTMEQVYSQFKDSFAAQMSGALMSLEKRMGAKVKIDPEKHPGFREEWLKVLGRLNAQYDQILGEQKEKLRKIK